MFNLKRMLSATLALVLCLMLVPAGSANAAEVQTGGYENGNGLDLNKIGSYVSGISNPDGGVAEIVSYDVVENKAWVVNGATGMLDILDLNTIEDGDIFATSLDIKALAAEVNPGFFYGDMTSVSVCSDLKLVAVALQAEGYDAAGYVGILNTDGEMLGMIEAGFQPDMVTFTPDGSKILVANEGEPRNGYGEGVVDPAGSVTIIWLDVEDPASSSHRNVGFEAFDEKREELVANGVMLTKGNLPSVDLEPEYIACDSNTAYITLQEANAVAVLDLTTEDETAFFVNYINTRDFSENPSEIEPHLSSDVAPEGLYFIPESRVLLAAFEVSGTVSAYSVGSTEVSKTEPTVTETVAPEVTEPTIADTAEAVEPANTWMVILTVIVVAVAAVFVLFKKK